MKHSIRKYIFYLARKSGSCFFQKPQRYQIHSELFLKNTSEESQNGWLVIPLPCETLCQKIVEKPKFVGFAPEIQYDEIFENPFAIWKFALPRGEEKTLSFECVIEVMPRFFHGSKREIWKKAHDIYERVIKELEYGNPIEGLYSAQEALEKKIVDCGGFSTLFVAWCEKEGIPARIVSGFLAGYPAKIIPGFVSRAPKNLMHAWAEFGIEKDIWIPVDPSTEKLVRAGREFRSGKFGFVGSDRIIFSHGFQIPVQIEGKKISIPLLQNPMIISQNVNIGDVVRFKKTFVVDYIAFYVDTFTHMRKSVNIKSEENPTN